MLFSIVPRFGNTWFLLCLERLDADWLNGCVCLEALYSDCFYCMWYLLCLEILHSDCFCCMWYCYHAFSLDECPSSPADGRIFCCSLHSNWLGGLEKKEASIVEMASNSFVISEINLYQSYLKASI